ncbi:MAG: DUF3786 domain-containing protein [Oscillospiraceae bacterium]|jgi:hypothetical protein|nr:DUF3786 domain-containing protein [Oscillospiraceae bacterium]
MDLVNNKEGRPLAHYRELYAQMDPSEVSARTHCVCAAGGLEIPIFGHTLTAAVPDFKLTGDSGCPAALLAAPCEILILRWLINGRAAPFGGKFLSYREIPWGNVYDANFNGRCRLRLSGTFGRDLDSFSRAARRLCGYPAPGGDSAFDLPLPGGNTLRLIIYSGDEEFSPAAQILFSDNITAAWSAEDLAVLGEVAIRALSEKRN